VLNGRRDDVVEELQQRYTALRLPDRFGDKGFANPALSRVFVHDERTE
jgi:hypothetical protein